MQNEMDEKDQTISAGRDSINQLEAKCIKLTDDLEVVTKKKSKY